MRTFKQVVEGIGNEGIYTLDKDGEIWHCPDFDSPEFLVADKTQFDCWLPYPRTPLHIVRTYTLAEDLEDLVDTSEWDTSIAQIYEGRFEMLEHE